MVALVGLLASIGAYGFFQYRDHVAVNTAAETAEGLLTRAKEEAKASGYALADDLRADGVGAAAPGGRLGEDGSVALRLRKRYRAGEPLQLVATKDLSASASLAVETTGAGTLDLDIDGDLEGVFFEILVNVAGTTTVVATIPVDVNGEMIFQGKNGSATIRFSKGSYMRTITLSRRGVIEPDRR